MRLLNTSIVLLAALLSLVFSPLSYSVDINSDTTNAKWHAYPQDLPQLDFAGNKLKEHWPTLAAATKLPFPDATVIESMLKSNPRLAEQQLLAANKEGAHPALSASMNDYQELALLVQDVWRLHFQGQYQQAYSMGISLGPIAMGPALYAKLIYTTYLVKDAKQKEQLFVEADQEFAKILPFADKYDFIFFGDAYQKARRLELMSTSAATASGLITVTQDTLEKLQQHSPDHPLYVAIIASIDAGIIERVGGFVAGMTFGADEDESMALFKKVLQSYPSLTVLHNEFAQFILRLDDSDYDSLLLATLKRCDSLTAVSAEEALNQRSCRQLLQQRL